MQIKEIVKRGLFYPLDFHFLSSEGAIATIVTLLFLCYTAVFAFAGLRLGYYNKFYPGTVVAGVNVGGQTYDQANQTLSDRYNNINKQTLVMDVAGHLYQAPVSQLGFFVDWQTSLSLAYNQGHSGDFLNQGKDMVTNIYQGLHVPLQIAINSQKMNAYIDSIVATTTAQPVNATITASNGQFVVSAGTPGVGVDKKTLYQSIVDTLKQNLIQGPWRQLVYASRPVEPDLTAQSYTQVKQQADAKIQTPFTFTLGNKTYTADKTVMVKWFSFTVSGNQVQTNINQGAVANYVASLAGRIDIRSIDKKLSTKDNSVVEEGKDGLALIQAPVIPAIIAALNNPAASRTIALQTQVIPFGTKTVFPPFTPGLYDGKYIEVNLSTQTLYAFDGNAIQKSFLISSGIASHPTLTGTFYIYGKNASSLMKGPGYYLPNVPWVSWWHGDYSIHGTYWHHNFGHPMSHGCLNASTPDAKWIYDWAPVGTPVYIHK